MPAAAPEKVRTEIDGMTLRRLCSANRAQAEQARRGRCGRELRDREASVSFDSAREARGSDQDRGGDRLRRALPGVDAARDDGTALRRFAYASWPPLH